MFTIIELLLSAAAIVVAAALFTNAIEILGERLNLGAGAVGSILAAVGTALPETMIPVVAIVVSLFTGASAAGDIGVGAILGAPFLLATLAMFVVGIAVWSYQRRRESGDTVTVDVGTAKRDTLYFLGLYSLGAAAGILPLPFYAKVVLAIALVAAYVLFIRQTVKADVETEGDLPENLTLWPSSSEAPTWAVAAQVVGTIAVMAVGAHFFVSALEHLSKSVGVPAGLIALVLAPLATELPEKFNSVIWLRRNKDTLALGNITGAMVFQSSIPVALGLAFTDWTLDSLNIFSVTLALLGGAYLYVLLRREKPIEGEHLLVGGVLYAAFVAAAIFAIV
ncbi:MAG: sodium:calcium antiporter [Actinomycetota bacterium]|nr:sodium:calcium antiporter [Actinomycetota bacterium]